MLSTGYVQGAQVKRIVVRTGYCKPSLLVPSPSGNFHIPPVSYIYILTLFVQGEKYNFSQNRHTIHHFVPHLIVMWNQLGGTQEDTDGFFGSINFIIPSLI